MAAPVAGLAAAVASSRVVTGAHFPSDAPGYTAPWVPVPPR